MHRFTGFYNRIFTSLNERKARVIKSPQSLEIQIWPIDKLVFYARNPCRNDAAADRMCSSIREFGFKYPCWREAMAKSSTAICA